MKPKHQSTKQVKTVASLKSLESLESRINIITMMDKSQQRIRILLKLSDRALKLYSELEKLSDEISTIIKKNEEEEASFMIQHDYYYENYSGIYEELCHCEFVDHAVIYYKDDIPKVLDLISKISNDPSINN